MVVYIPLLIVGLGAALTGALSNNVLAHYAALLVTGFVALATAVVVRHDLLAIGLTLGIGALSLLASGMLWRGTLECTCDRPEGRDP